MILYDQIIKDTLNTLSVSAKSHTEYAYRADRCRTDNGRSFLIMQTEAAYELGGNQLPSANLTCVTTTAGLVQPNTVSVYGDDLCAIKKDVSFARITLIEAEFADNDDEALYNSIRGMDFVRYHVFPDGYMARVSSESNEERVRVSKKAIKSGITFESVGNSYIRKYKEIPGVKNVQVIFITDSSCIPELAKASKKVDAITSTLTHILDGLPTDCSHCSLKSVCDEVEGMREMHMKHK